MGMYSVLSVLFVVLVYRIISKGPEIRQLADAKGLTIMEA
jgi:hypothetical protein